MTINKGMLAVPVLFVALAAVNCSKSSFGGSGGVKGASLDSTAGDKDAGADAADGEGLGNSDSAADASDLGMNDLGGRDTDVPGADSSDGIDDGGLGSDADGGSGDDGDNSDSPDADDPSDDKTKKKKKKGGDDKDGDDDDETLAKTKYGATVTRILADDAFDMKIEVMVSGKVLNTATLSWEDDMNDEVVKVAAGVCRAGKDTCMRITFTNTDDNGNHGGHVETAGVTPCVFIQESGTTATVDFDANGGEGGGFHQGTCRPGEDEQLTISCPNSKKLQVQACGK